MPGTLIPPASRGGYSVMPQGPSRIPSAFLAASKMLSGSVVPFLRYEAMPTSLKSKPSSRPNAVLARSITVIATSVISGPMSSPGSTRIFMMGIRDECMGLSDRKGFAMRSTCNNRYYRIACGNKRKNGSGRVRSCCRLRRRRASPAGLPADAGGTRRKSGMPRAIAHEQNKSAARCIMPARACTALASDAELSKTILL